MLYIIIAALFIAGLIAAFKKADNKVVGVGFVYVIRRNNGASSDPHISTGFMRELAHPWRVGKGVQVRLGVNVFQLGLCRKTKHEDEMSGFLSAMQARMLEEPIEKIREW